MRTKGRRAGQVVGQRRVWGLAAVACAVWTVGCDGKADDPDYTQSPGYQGPPGDPGVVPGQPTRPNRARISVSPTRLDFSEGDVRATLKVRSTGARTLTVNEVDLVPGEDWRVLLGSSDPRFTAGVLTDPDGDGRDGMAAGTEFSLSVQYLGERSADASATLVVRSNDPETPEVAVPLRYTLAAVEVDQGVGEDFGLEPDAGPPEDAAVPDAGPAPDCVVDNDCALVMALASCNPCPYAAPRSAVSPNECRPAFDEATTFFAYQPSNCIETCFGQPLSFCPDPPRGVQCRDGVCALNP